MRICVQLFALARELAGADTIEIEIPKGATVAQLRDLLAARSEPLAELVRHSMVAVDAAYATDDTTISSDSEVALIPPVSGG